MLYKKWFFWCECNRCRDRSECGSYLGGLMCPMKRCGGTLLADNPLDRESDYSCLSCNHRLEFKQAEMILSKAEKDIRTPNNKFNLIEHMENFLDMQSKLLHPFNYIMVTVKLKLGCMYGNCPPYSAETLPRPLMERKLQVCLDVMDALDHIDPGYSKWRGKIETELSMARLIITKHTMDRPPASYYEKALVEKQFIKMYKKIYGSVLFT